MRDSLLHSHPLGFHLSRAALSRPAVAEVVEGVSERQRDIMAYRQLAAGLVDGDEAERPGSGPSPRRCGP